MVKKKAMNQNIHVVRTLIIDTWRKRKCPISIKISALIVSIQILHVYVIMETSKVTNPQGGKISSKFITETLRKSHMVERIYCILQTVEYFNLSKEKGVRNKDP